MAAQPTPGAVAAISEHADGGNGTLQPVLQVVDVRIVSNVKSPTNHERFRMLLSDGVHTMQSMLATAENVLIHNGSIQKGSIIHLHEFTCSTIQNHRIIIIIKLDVLQSECAIIGDPKAYDVRIQPNEQGTNFAANAAQANTGTYSSGPGMLGSSAAPRPLQDANNVPYGSSAAPRPVQDANNVPYGSSAAPRPVQDANNVPYGGSYGGYQGTVGPPIGRAVESVSNVASGVSYGTTSAHNNTMNVGMVQSNLQQPSLNSHQNRRFAVPSMAGGSGAPGNTYGQPAQSFYQQPPPGHMNRTPVSKNDASRLVPVAHLNPYQNTWTIKARVTAKTDLRHYNNNKGAGKVFSFDLLDGQGGEIRATCFNAQADQFFDLIEVDKVYLISKGSVKPARKLFNSLNHEYEITLDFKSSIEVCVDDDSNIPRQQYNFRQISEIENLEAGAIVDLIGIVTSVGPSATIIRKVGGSEAQKRTLQLKDMSGQSVEITLWGKFCDAEGQQLQLQCDSGLNPVLALKGARVTEFSGRSVNTIGSTQLKIDPDFPEAESLRRWYATEGKTAACVSLSGVSMGRTDVRKAVAQIKDEDLGRSEKPDFITVKGAISHLITDNFCYPACTMEVNGRVCNKKVINNGDGTWQCDKCDQSLPKCEYRYLLQCQIQDHTGVTYATAFQEAGIEIVGHSAYELYNIREEDPERFAEILQGVRWHQFLFKLKVKEETFNDEQRVKCSITRAEKLDPAKESSYLLGVINGLLQDDTGSPSVAQGAMAYNAGLSNTGAGRSVPTSNSAYTTNMSGPMYGESVNQFAQQAKTYIGAPTPVSVTGNVQTCMSCGSSGHNAQNCPAGMYRQQPGVKTASSYGSSQPRNAGPRPCFKCNQIGHFASSCPLLAPAPQQQQYRSGGALSGGYGQQQPYLGATNY
ncbi:replication protein A 70 kDa DNA-binding subunit C-like [Miscanthus floridulus]|uniref:replication protein A 70 kDa DNA-binding subunit C-like n=1 Tax=Miscanthus floridulus TaxID=154761 RepID=UPI003458ED09